MFLPKNDLKREKRPELCSLDRIDPNKGYIKGNVEFVCLFINLGKTNFSKEQVVSFLGNISI